MKKGLIFVAVLAAACYAVAGVASSAKLAMAGATATHKAAIEAAIGE